MRNATEAEVNDVFDRINTYGHRLSDQERRQAGVQNNFSGMIRNIACSLRGDVSSDVLPLYAMPSISIDLPMSRHGYQVQADEVFWVNQGVLLSTDLRDSLDEQCTTDIAACIVGGELIERSKDALDEIYNQGTQESERILTGLDVYGAAKFSDELKYCIGELLSVCATGKPEKLRDIVFTQRTTNAFPSIFAVIIIAIHELIVRDGKEISDYAAVKRGLTNLTSRIETGRKATVVDERRKNIDTIKGLISPGFVGISRDKLAPKIYSNHTAIDIESIVRRSEIELGNYELKQGLLIVQPNGGADPGMIEKIVKTICAIANNGPNSHGKILIGVTDKDADAARIKEIDGVDPIKVGKRFVIGVNREAARLALSLDKYIAILKEGIRKSALSEHVRDAVLSNMDFNSFYGLGVIVITIPSQKELSYVGDQLYWRNADSTELADTTKRIATLAQRF
jgi:Putative DNA-binding domain